MRIKKVIINSIHLDVLQNYQILYTLKEVEGGGGDRCPGILEGRRGTGGRRREHR